MRGEMWCGHRALQTRRKRERMKQRAPLVVSSSLDRHHDSSSGKQKSISQKYHNKAQHVRPYARTDQHNETVAKPQSAVSSADVASPCSAYACWMGGLRAKDDECSGDVLILLFACRSILNNLMSQASSHFGREFSYTALCPRYRY